MTPSRSPTGHLSVEPLEARLAPSYLPGSEVVLVSQPRFVAGSGAGAGEVRVYDAGRVGGPEVLRLAPFGPGHSGGVSVATADVTGDAVPDVVAGMAAGGSAVKVFDGASGAELLALQPFAPSFLGGVSVAVGRRPDGPGWAVVVGAGPGGGPHVKAFDAATGEVLRSFFAFDPGFLGGVCVAAGDVTGDGAADLVVGAGAGGGPHVKAFDGRTGETVRSFYAYPPNYAGGVNVAVTTLYGVADIVTGPGEAGQQVKLFGPADTAVLTTDAFADSGARVAVANFRGEGTDALTFPQLVVGAGPGGSPHTRVLDTAAVENGAAREVYSFFAFDPALRGGASVAAAPRAFAVRGPVDGHAGP